MTDTDKSEDRAYVRNGVAGWPVERQRQVLADKGFSGPIYEDTLTRGQLRGRNVAALEDRAQMLHPTSGQAPERIWVATIRALGLTTVDLMAALAAAKARHATVFVVNTGLEITPNAGAAELAAAAADWDADRRAGQTLAGREKGHLAAEATKAANREPKLAQANEVWGKPSNEITTKEVSRLVGLSVTALYNHLGPRSHAQRRAKQKAAQVETSAPAQTDLEDFTGPPKAVKRKRKANV